MVRATVVGACEPKQTHGMTVLALDRDGAGAADPSETSRLSEAITRLLPALEEFNRFEGIDQAARERGRWLDALERELPEQGCGLDEVLRELAEVAIPYGLRNGGPGFNGWESTATSSRTPTAEHHPRPREPAD
jgi:hypothetical protein